MLSSSRKRSIVSAIDAFVFFFENVSLADVKTEILSISRARRPASTSRSDASPLALGTNALSTGPSPTTSSRVAFSSFLPDTPASPETPRQTSAASPSWGTHLGLTKLVISISSTPVAHSSSTSLHF